MSGASLLPVVGAAGAVLARSAAAAVGEGLSFAAELSRGLGPSCETANAKREADSAERRAELERRIQAFAERIKQHLKAAGIDVSQPLTLTSDGLGGITAADHPQRAAIESLLESDVLLLRDFDQLQDDYEAIAGDTFQLPIAQPMLP